LAGLKDPPTEARLSFLHETALLPFVDAVGSTHRCAGNYRLLSGGGSVPIPPPMAPAGPTREKQQNPVETEESEPQRHRDTEETQSHPPTREPRRHQDTENLRRPPTHPDRPQITQMNTAGPTLLCSERRGFGRPKTAGNRCVGHPIRKHAFMLDARHSGLRSKRAQASPLLFLIQNWIEPTSKLTREVEPTCQRHGGR